jgi:opacity protein-like surface antigen
MQLKPYVGLVLAPLLVCSLSAAIAQTAPAALESRFPLAIGAGFSGYNPDLGHGHLLGGVLWMDYSLQKVPWFLQGIGIQAEARDLNYGRSVNQPPNLREDCASGGAIYSWPHSRRFRPYGKFSLGYGNTDSVQGKPSVRKHDSRTVMSGGGGVDFHVYRTVWLRADYEYQSWPNFFKHPGTAQPAGVLNPQGFTIGAMYHFSTPRLR